MNSNPVMNPKSVTWGSLSLDGVRSVIVRQKAATVADSSDGDLFESVVAAGGVATEAVVVCENIPRVFSALVGGEAELRFTLDGARPGDDPVTFVAPAAVLIERRVDGKHGEIASGVLRFSLRSADGTTAPLTVS